jgi:hypothetical protein
LTPPVTNPKHGGEAQFDTGGTKRERIGPWINHLICFNLTWSSVIYVTDGLWTKYWW